MKAFDLEDALLVAGVLSLCGGVACIYWPASFILFGLLCFLGVYLIGRSRTKAKAD